MQSSKEQPKFWKSHKKSIEEAKDTMLKALYKRSRSNPVKSKTIERSMGLSGPAVRSVIADLRKQGFPIVSSGKGYHYDHTPQWSEIGETIQHLKERINAMESVIGALQKVCWIPAEGLAS